MKIVVAIDSFKGSLRTTEANRTVYQSLHTVLPEAEILTFPIADGGEGMLEVIREVIEGEIVMCEAHDALMRLRKTEYLQSSDGKVAFIELAAINGLPLLTDMERNPLQTTTYGTGELIGDALCRGCRQFIIGLGGSSTNDAGLGMLQALGYRFYNKQGEEIIEAISGKFLSDIHYIDGSKAMPELKEARFLVACDVQNPFCGLNGAAHVFAPQKGADNEMVVILDKGLQNIARIIYETTGTDVNRIPGAGAAGGVGGSMSVFLKGTLKPGIELLLDLQEFDRKIKGASLIITGEGKSDKQTLMGKVPFGILKRAQKAEIPTLLIAGQVEDTDTLINAGFHKIICINPPHFPLSEAIKPEVATTHLRDAIIREMPPL